MNVDLGSAICFINRKGGTIILFGYYLYKMPQYKNGSAVWRCSNYKKLKPVPQNKAIVGLEDSGLNFVDTIPSLSNIQHCLYSIRNKSINCSITVFNNLDEVQIPENFSSFILTDYLLFQTQHSNTVQSPSLNYTIYLVI